MIGGWTARDDARLLEMAEAGTDLADVAYEFRRTVASIKARLKLLRMTPEKRAAELANFRKRNRLRRRAVYYEATGKRCVPGKPIHDAAMRSRLAEAASLRPRDLTGAIMGDPPVGRSALDARR